MIIPPQADSGLPLLLLSHDSCFIGRCNHGITPDDNVRVNASAKQARCWVFTMSLVDYQALLLLRLKL
jgi:hypothetical protein